jgi:hypothetical protein
MLQYASFLILSVAVAYSIIMKGRDWEKDRHMIQEKYYPSTIKDENEYEKLSPMAKKFVDTIIDIHILRKNKTTIGNLKYDNYNDIISALKYVKNRGINIEIDELNQNLDKNRKNYIEFTMQS